MIDCTSAREKLEAYSDRSGDCWLWTRRIHAPSGYGQIWTGGKHEYVHRVAYREYVGPIPDGLCVLHHCDVRHCVNPHHLWLGTHTDNMLDMQAKGRQRYFKGSALPIAKLTEADIPEIRALLADGIGLGAIAKRYGVNKSTIAHIRYGKTWKHV